MKKVKMVDAFLKALEIIILGIILGMLSYVCYGVYKENSIPLVEDVNDIEETKNVFLNQGKDEDVDREKVLLPSKYLDFPVSARLEIPKINLYSYVLEEYNEEGMDKCISKYWGPNANEVGNFCIAGHNYEDNNNMFCHLIDLKIGDTLYLSDNKYGKYSYTIYDIYRVRPSNTAPLRQETGGKRIVTLITCVNYSRNRLIVQAIEN